MTVTVKHNKVSAIADSGDTSLVQPSDWNADHTIVGLGTSASLDAGVPNGVATLDSGGKVPTSQIPQMGDLNYQGTWNASTNTPTLTSSVGTKGYYYVVSVAGTTNLNGITDWQVGDWAVYNGSAWQKIDNTDAVTSVNGYTGTVVLTQSDISGTANAPTNTNITSMTGITGGISSPDFIAFDTTYTTPLTAGQLGWDGNNTLGLGMSGGNIIQQIGLQTFIYGKASSAITKGQLIKKTGANGSSGVITFAPTTANMTNSSDIIGIAAEDIALNGFGYIISTGNLKGINTSGSGSGETWADGDILYYNPSGNGLMTNVKPSAPNLKVEVGIVTNAGSGGSGSLAVEIIHGSVLGGTDSNVQINGVTGGQLLSYDQTNGYWKNTNLAAGTGISVNSSTGGIITVTNTAPDQTVVISAGTGISVSGTYPNFTVTNTSPSSGGTVTNVSGTAPISVANGTTTPTISISQASSTTNGFLSSTDWNIFNNKQPAGSYVTSVSGSTGRITSTGGTTPVIDLASGVATPGTTGSSTLIPVITIDTYGRVTGITTASNPQGTVTSVAATAGTGITISGSPITSSGTLVITNSGVTSLTGTANQVTVSASTGGVTLSLPSTINVNTSGNAATVTNGVYTTGSYADPTWITSLSGSKISGTIDGGTF